jgi:hypothetical protein
MEYAGRVHNGQIDIEGKVTLPEGAQVIVTVLDHESQWMDQGITGEELLAAPFIGAWADRDDIGDTAEFAEKLRSRSNERS